MVRIRPISLAERGLETIRDAASSGKNNKPAKSTTLLGALSESLVTLSVRTYAQTNEARVHHLRTRAGEHELDLIPRYSSTPDPPSG